MNDQPNDAVSDMTTSQLLERLSLGEEGPAQGQLFEAYFHWVVTRASRWLPKNGVVGPDDVALSVMRTLFRRLPAGNLPECKDATRLRQLLAKITFRKAVNNQAWLFAAKRHPCERQTDAEVLKDCLKQVEPECRQVAKLFFIDELSREQITETLDLPPPLVDRYIHRVRKWLERRRFIPQTVLSDEALAGLIQSGSPIDAIVLSDEIAALPERDRDLALLLLEGYSTGEIAAKKDMSQRHVQRLVLDMIRRLEEK